MDDGRFWGMVMLVAVAVGAIALTAYWVSAKQDCERRGGVLVEDSGGWWYACVEPKR